MNDIKYDLPMPLRCSTQMVGFYDQFLYISPATVDGIEIWRVQTLIPKSFERMIKLDVQEVEIKELTLSPNGENIYCMFIGILPDFEMHKVYIARITTETAECKIWELDFESGDAFEQVFVNNIGLVCGQEKLYMYDRTLIMGDIPFWEFEFKDERDTFLIKANHIPAHDSSYHCTRFPVMYNPDNREVIKIDGGQDLLIFDGANEQWVRYSPAYNNQLDLSSISNRGIQETYGRTGHRVKAVQTKLTIYGREHSCIFKVSEHRLHKFYTFTLNRDHQTYKLEKRKRILRQTEEISYRFACTDKCIAFVGRQMIAFIMIQPPQLRELGFWGVQKLFAKKQQNGSWIGGKTEEELREYFHIKTPLI